MLGLLSLSGNDDVIPELRLSEGEWVCRLLLDLWCGDVLEVDGRVEIIVTVLSLLLLELVISKEKRFRLGYAVLRGY